MQYIVSQVNGTLLSHNDNTGQHKFSGMRFFNGS